MTTTHDAPVQQPKVYRPQVNPTPVTLRRVLSSEWVKLRTLRSSWITMILAVAGLVVVAIAGGILTNQDWSHMHPGELAHFEPIGDSLTGINFSQLAVGVLGVLFITGEYGTGMIRSTLAAAPKRLPVLWAKAILFAAVTLVSMEIAAFVAFFAAFVAFFAGQAALGSHGTTIAATGALRATVGTGLYLTVVALLGIALGFIIRSTAGGIAALFGVLLVLPGILAILPQTWQDNIGPYLPSNAGAALYTVQSDTTTLAPWTGFAVFCLYAAIALAAAATVLKRRDA